MNLEKGVGISHCNKKLGNKMEIMHLPALVNLLYLMVISNHHSWIQHIMLARFYPYFNLFWQANATETKVGIKSYKFY